MVHGPKDSKSLPIFPNKYVLAGLFAIVLFLLVFRLDHLPLKFEEPRRALVATEMLTSGNFVTPKINGEFYYNKPPLFNWLIAGSFTIFGFNDWAERLPTLLSILAIFALNFLFFRRKLGRDVSLLSSLFFILSGHMLFYFSFQGEIDMTFSFVVFAQVICIFHYFDRRKWFYLFFASYLLMTIGFLMKGLPSIAFQGLTLAGIFVWHREYKKLFHVAHFAGVLLSGALLLGYFHAYADFNNPEILLAKLTMESARRTTEGGGILLYLSHLAKFPLLLLTIMIPGSLVILFAKNFDWRKVLENKWLRYSFIFLLFNLPLYWISPGTRDRYLYMFLPFIYNILIFLSLNSLVKSGKSISIFLYAISSLLALGLGILPFLQEGIPWVWSIIVPLLVIVVLIAVRNKKIHSVFGLMLVMLCLKIYYDLVVFPIRAKSEDNIAATIHANEVSKITRGEKLMFVGPFEMKELALPLREPVAFKEIDRLPYQFSYYYSSATKTVIQWTDQMPLEGFYITSLTSENQAKAVYQFEMEGRSFVLIKN